MKIAVYGTLKRGYGNNRLLSTSTFLEERVISGYRLVYSGGEGSFPVAFPDEKSKVAVEIFEITEDTRKRLDQLESEGYMYNRTQVGDVEMYIGNEKMWSRGNEKRIECPQVDGIYVWERN